MVTEPKNILPAALAQFEAQGQLQGQAEAQGQLQGQAELQGQGQGQLQGQGQDQGQGQSQGQEQYSSNEANNYAGNAVESYSGNANLNGNGNLNGNANGNLNGNANLNYSENGVANHVENGVTNTVDTSVTTSVNVSVSGEFDPPSETGVLHMDSISIGDLDGNFVVMPDFSTQTLTGDGNIFNLDQVNSLVDNDTLSGASVSLSIGGSGGGEWGITSLVSPEPGGPSFSFNQTATATGGTGTNTTDIGDHGTATGTANAANALTQEAFTQHIVMGANIQYNSMPINVVGGDSISDAAAGADS